MFDTLMENFPKNSILSDSQKIKEISDKFSVGETIIRYKLSLLSLPETIKM